MGENLFLVLSHEGSTNQIHTEFLHTTVKMAKTVLVSWLGGHGWSEANTPKHGGKRQPTPASWPLTFTCTHVCTDAQNINLQLKQRFFL